MRGRGQSAWTVSAVTGFGVADSSVSMARRSSIAAGSDLVSENPVTRAQCGLFKHADAIDKAIEMFAEASIAACAVRGFQQGVECTVEFGLGTLEVAKFEFLLTGFKVRV